MGAEARHIEVKAKRFEYEPAQITVKKGEPVVLVMESLDAHHGIKFKELGIEADLPKGKTVEVPITSTKAGTFVGLCSHFCGRGHGQMKFTLTVTE